ncbi:hypothetical protein CLV33_101247 [Jejuia pallidilutea]|uniref:Glycerophosphoryl diester phosphodiesterase membrane domain-containing protein n=1 Tax=Jejuia pallidilutea TaxID=504487 RepID=A0A362X3M9_9FLAO|nr:hypothetical protein [Jejuia pallidilutea]PQV51324.1 hypothetical protein CLV33_101247 [Jejuia pallidilutea]
MNTLKTIIDKVETAKDLDFGSIFSESIELFKKVWLQGFIVILLTGLFVLPFYILMYAPLIASGMLEPNAYESQPDMAVLLPFYGLLLVTVFAAIVISFGLKSAFFRICKQKDAGETTKDDYFYYFKAPYLGKTIKLGAISFGLIIAAYILCVFPIIYMMVPVAIINVIYAYNPDMSASDIVNASFKLGNKKWLIIFGLMLVSGFLASIVGTLMCFIGTFFTASFAYIPLYFIYKHVIGFDDKSEIEQIGSGEVL